MKNPTKGMEFPPWPVVYAISASNRRVKIGHSTNMAKRFSDLQHASPYKLRILGTMPGGVAEERWLHREFQKYRRHGEWFDLSSAQLQRLLDFMALPNPGRLEPKKPNQPQHRSGKVRRSVVPPEVTAAAIAHVHAVFRPENVPLVLEDAEVMLAFQRNIARKMRREGQL